MTDLNKVIKEDIINSIIRNRNDSYFGNTFRQLVPKNKGTPTDL